MSQAQAQVFDRLKGGQRREIVTPEGVPLQLTLASDGDRAIAFFYDLFAIMAAVLLSLVPLAVLGSLGSGGGWGLAFGILASFLIRNFYFIWFEVRWQGSTPGKRRAGIRVVDRSGGTLEAGSVIARNLTREAEVFLPLTALLLPQALWPSAPGWGQVLSSIWLVIFALMPVFNRDRLRIGDLIAGTMVVAVPKAMLLADVGATSEGRASTYTFSQEQLGVYGIFELQVLEEVLRRRDDSAMRRVSEQIEKKIKWRRSPGHFSPKFFLRDFYAAQRKRLEGHLLMGKRREDKYSDVD